MTSGNLDAPEHQTARHWMEEHLNGTEAVASRGGACVVSFDRDYDRFPGLRWMHPADDLAI